MVNKLTDKELTIFGNKFDSQVMVTVKMLDKCQIKTDKYKLRDRHRRFYGVLEIFVEIFVSAM